MKKINYFVLFNILLFISITNTYANTTGTVVVDDYLNVRNTINGSSISKLTNGTVITITNTNAGSTSACKSWYKIKYGNYNTDGYACGDYISLLTGYASCAEDPTPVGVWKDTNKSGKVTSVSCDRGMTILDKDIASNSKCKNNWYKVSFNGKVGYSCSTYVYFNKPISTSTSYERPWTSPMKAIVGGAEFIAENYIAKGQYTSYLKKFNVNPNSAYSTYNHQYMANLQAPSSEAKSSYNSYNNNGLLKLPLTFIIPIYNNMPTSTTLPGNSTDNSGQTNVTDSNFEAKLNSQGFNETYKKKLRALHTKHPNWTFESLKTNLDFNAAVRAEGAVSSIQGGGKYYKLVNGGYVQTESGWYLANDATVGYYLDPRNFLNEQGILMFESLKHSSNYTESVVQSVINNTFMKGSSTKDNKTYASIFVEAGKSKNISPVYLASLAKQESGVNGSMATTGNQFTYKNVTYIGLYNFFNIGAYSSEESPIKAGLVWASGGDTCTIVGSSCNKNTTNTTNSNNNTNTNNNSNTTTKNNNSNNITNTPKASPTPTPNPTPTITNKGSNYYVSNLGVRNNSGYINGLSVGTTVNTIKSKLNNAKSVTITNVKGKGISGNTPIGTGSTIKVIDQDNKTSYSYSVVIYGDVNGDGKITASDYVTIKNYIMKKTTLKGATLKGADSNKNGSVTASDYVVIKNYIMGKTNISQK